MISVYKTPHRAAGVSSSLGALAVVVALGLQVASFSANAAFTQPEFTFNDRCVPYEIDPDFMRANGVDPDKILSTFQSDPPIPTAPWVRDVDEFGNDVPCDEFHTAKRRTRYEACYFYDGTPCYFTTNGQLDQNAFTDDEAGRIAHDLAEHFVFYEVVQNFRSPFTNPPFPPPNTGGFEVIAPAADPFCCGFAIGNQVKIMNGQGTYFEDDPLGLWSLGFIQFNQKAFDCGDPALPDPLTQTEECAFLNQMRADNGLNAQAFNLPNSQNDPLNMPLLVNGDNIFDLLLRELISLRYRTGGDGVPGAAEGPRYILCPVHEDPTQGSLEPGQDIIQSFPTHVEFQPPCGFTVLPDDDDPAGRGHLRVCEDQPAPDPCGGPGQFPCLTQVAYPFGLTPPPGDDVLYEEFDCLQRTGDWCTGEVPIGEPVP